jgi:MFS family permease
MFVGIGIAFAYWWDFAFSFVGGPFAWRWPIAFQAVFAFWVIFVVFGVPESPRWLLNHGKRKEAIEVLSAIYDKPIDHPDIIREVTSIEAALSTEAEAEGNTTWASTFRKDKVSTRYRVFLAWFVQFMNQAGGINLVVYYILSKLQSSDPLYYDLDTNTYQLSSPATSDLNTDLHKSLPDAFNSCSPSVRFFPL